MRMNPKPIPCKECIARPACRNKKQIICGMLYRWNNSVRIDWKTVHNYLPMADIVLPESIEVNEVLCLGAATSDFDQLKKMDFVYDFINGRCVK